MAYPDPYPAGAGGPARRRQTYRWERPPSWMFWRRRYWRRRQIAWASWEFIHERKLARNALEERCG